MPTTLPRTAALALRSGCRTAGSGVVVFSRQFDAGEGPCDLLLALAEAAEGADTGAAEQVLLAARQCMARTAGAGGSPPLVELLAAAHVWGRRVGADAPVRLSLLAVRGSEYAAAQARSLPACLLRDGALRPLSPEYPLQPPAEAPGAAAALEPELVTGALADGDALLLGSNSLHERLGDRTLSRLLTRTAGPEAAADRVVEEALAEGGSSVAAAILFAGVGPALMARLKPATASPPPVEHPLPPLPAPPPPAPVSWVAATAAVGGIALGIGLGVLLALRILGAEQPPGVVTVPSPPPVATVAPPRSLPPATVEPAPQPTPSPGAPPAAPAPEATPPTPPQPAAQAQHPGETAPPAPVQPAVLEGPPAHPLADGFGAGARLFLRADPARGLLLVQSSQGVLYGSSGGPGVPVGEALVLPLATLRGQPGDDLGQLRLYQGDRAAGSLSSDDVRNLLAGRQVGIPDLRPGDYQLRWWHPQSGAGEPLYTLRLAG